MAKPVEAVDPDAFKFGTFKGVFTPSILTILGVVMYLRFGWVLGNVGLEATLIIVTLATSITFLTGLSLSALATNMKVGGGGAYYIISRALGLETGAAVGVPLYFAQALGVSFYIAGFAESVLYVLNVYGLESSVPPWLLDARIIGLITLLLLTALAYKSASLALKTQYLVMAVIIASLVSFFMGGKPEVPAPESVPAPLSFWPVFAVFFPAVTGIEAGIAMSGDLKNPAKSLPTGTICAVISGYLVYMAIPIFLHHTIEDNDRLLGNPLIMASVAKVGALIYAGVWAASLSSAMGAILGAPRTMQALAVDHILPKQLGRGSGPANEPRMATAITFCVAGIGIMAGDLNAIAGVLSMFFLTSYGLLNLSAGVGELMNSPAWRPKFRVHWVLSFVGAFGCLATMFMINAGATIIATGVSIGIYYVMKRRSLRANWGDMRSGIAMMIIRKAIEVLALRKLDEQTWRPNLLVLSGTPTRRWHLIELANAIASDRGFLTIATVVPEDTHPDRLETMSKTISTYLDKRGIFGLARVFPAGTPIEGMQMLSRAYGFGPIAPNTILLGETERQEHYAEYARLIQLIRKRRQNLIVVLENEDMPQFLDGNRIDLWMSANQQNRGLMLALAYLLGRSPGWRQATLNIMTIVSADSDMESAARALEDFVVGSRIDAIHRVIIKQDKGVFATIASESAGADLVFMGIRAPEDDETAESYASYFESLQKSTDALPPTALVLANESINFSAIFENKV